VVPREGTHRVKSEKRSQDLLGSIGTGIRKGSVGSGKPKSEYCHHKPRHRLSDSKNEGQERLHRLSTDRQVNSPRRFPVSNKIIIIISGGAVQGVTKPKGVALEIRDYDVEASDIPENNEHYQRDDSGDWFQRMFWGEDQIEG
jgi:hypothetical protein